MGNVQKPSLNTHGIVKHNPHRSVSDLCGLVLDAPVWVSGGFLG